MPAASNTCSSRWPEPTRRSWLPVTQALIAAANQRPELAQRLHDLLGLDAADLSQYRPRQGPDAGRRGQRHLYLAADQFGRFLREFFQSLRPGLAGQYPGRRAIPARDRRRLSDLCAQHRRASEVPLRALLMTESTLGPQSVIRYNNLSAAVINGTVAPGFSTGEAIAAMEQVSANTLPAGLYVRVDHLGAAGDAGGRTTPIILGLAVLFAYLFLVGALRELDDPGSGPALGDHRPARRAPRAVHRRPPARRLWPDRDRRADRARQQERDPDRRVRQGAARGRNAAGRRCGHGRPRSAFAP